MSELVEIRTYDGEGYKPLVDFGTWRVAFLRFLDELIPENIIRAEKHLETDEVFVLLYGQAVLLLGQGDERVEAYETYTMQPGLLYNVKAAAWHNVLMSRDAVILLVENNDTRAANSAYYTLTPEQRAFLCQTARELLPQTWE
ncbi:MAG TPA: hypothetical protein PKK90_01890 [Anaerolineaceae bacterium]|jgi:mannose-6-phosphate isomerase-like protein (cupin superfamily)|nr:hypothetical protein [Anaerolineaceae bacterium]HPT24371.1 hypothetical protein [Anaerolineaceae bacterium]